MTDFRAFASDLLALCDERDSAEAALASVQAQLDAANATVVEAQSDLASVEADLTTAQGELDVLRDQFAAYKASHPDAPPPVVPDVHEFSDFGVSGFSTGLMPAGDLVGKGSAVTRYRMKPDTATRPYNADTVVATALIRVGWGGQKVNVQGLTVEGTHVGPGVSGGAEQEYHGLMSKGGAGSTISDVTVTGIPGHGSGPLPSGGETSSLQLLRAGSHTLTNVQLDGRRGGVEPGIAASLFEMNYMTAGMVWNGGRANYATGGFGAALFQCGGAITFNDVDFRANRKAINIEASSAGTYRFVRCDLRGMTGAMYVAQISSLGLAVSAKVIFEDCIYNDDVLIVNTYTTAANKGQNGQKDSDIVRIDKGVTQPQGGPKFVLVHQ